MTDTRTKIKNTNGGQGGGLGGGAQGGAGYRKPSPNTSLSSSQRIPRGPPARTAGESPRKYQPPRDDGSLKSLQQPQTALPKDPLDQELEKRALDLLNKDKSLSKTQILKSYKRVLNWKKTGFLVASECLSMEDIEKDLDPAFRLNPSLKETSRPAPTSPLAPNERILKGEDFEALRAASVPPAEGLVEVSDVESTLDAHSIRNWLKKRDEEIQERDRLRKWIKSWQQSDQYTPANDLIQIWHKKRREKSLEEWTRIYEMEDNEQLTTNSLLGLYRESVEAHKNSVNINNIQN